MPSSFAWLDYSEQERRRALDVISLFKQPETRDELGLGSIRDALADRFSPGTMTMQTRARYFFLIPWMYERSEQSRVAGAKMDDWSRRFEIWLIDKLADADDSDGTIGIESRKRLQRMPSSIYWAGLGRLGIRIFSGSQRQYHRSLDGFYRSIRQLRALPSDPENRVEEPVNWHPHLPDPPDGFPYEVSLSLTAEEAEYLQDRIRAAGPGSLLAHLVDLDNVWDETDFAWQHPALEEFPQQLVEEVGHARMFSETLHGAALLYNLMLAQKIGQDRWIEGFEGRFEEWAVRLEVGEADVRAWDRRRFWQLVESQQAKVPYPTRAFVTTWIDMVAGSSSARDLKDSPKARRLISERELQLKRGRAKLHNRRYLELWRGDSGAAQLNFRWQITQSIALEILHALT